MLENIALYRVFYHVASCGSISEAARRMYIHQPAVSASIRQLEDALHVKLFRRSNRGITLTPEGKMLYSHVKKAFSFLESGEDKLRDMEGLREGVLRIGASDMTLRFYLLEYMGRFHAEYPGIRLQVTNAPTPDTLAALHSGQIDFGVISAPLPTDSAAQGLDFIPVRSIRDIFICAGDDPIADGPPLDRAALAALPLILLEHQTSTRRYLDAWFSEGGSTPEPAVELATSDLILEFVRRGIGVGCIVEDFAKDALTRGEVKKLSVTPEIPARSFYLAMPDGLPLSAAAKAFIDALTL